MKRLAKFLFFFGAIFIVASIFGLNSLDEAGMGFVTPELIAHEQWRMYQYYFYIVLGTVGLNFFFTGAIGYVVAKFLRKPDSN